MSVDYYAVTDSGFRAIGSPEDALPGEQAVTEIPQAVLAEIRKEEARTRRDNLLRGSDWTQMPDTAIPGPVKAEWVQYRKALRDLPTHPDFPDMEWPQEPARPPGSAGGDGAPIP